MTVLPSQMQRVRQPHTVFVTGGLGACAIAYLVFIFVPGQHAVTKLRREMNEKQQHILQSSSLTTPLIHSQARLEATEKCSAEWRAAAPSRSEIVAIYARLAEEAKAAGVSIQRFDPLAATDLKLVGQHNLALEWQGNFAQFFDFLARLEKLPPTIWVRQMHLNAAGEESETLQGELTLTIFVDLADNSD